jgi:membrane protein implicated in regulation of membrane protease activity
MSATVNVIIWWIGAIAVLVVLLICTIAVAYGLKLWADRILIQTLLMMRLSTARYWVNRMEQEGLTVCRKEYRRMVAGRRLATIKEFRQAEQEDTAREKGGAA